MPNRWQRRLAQALWVSAVWGLGGTIALPVLGQPCGSSLINTQIQALSGAAVDRAEAIAALVVCDASAVGPLLAELRDENQSWQVRHGATQALMAMEDTAIADLIDLLEDATASDTARKLALEGLVAIGKDADSDRYAEIQAALQGRRDDPSESSSMQLLSVLAADRLELSRPTPLFQTVLGLLQRHPAPASMGLGIAGSAGIYLTILLLVPRWLLWLPEDLTIPGTEISLSNDVLLRLKYPPRVLDWWVKQQLTATRQTFLRIHTVSERDIHVPLPIRLESREFVDPLTPEKLAPEFVQLPACLLIVGEGGIGKTSLACQIARWGLGLVEADLPQGRSLAPHFMLPVLIEQELGETTLLQAIQEQLPRSEDGSFISEDFLKALLRRGRVLVILDHVSEMTDHSYGQMQRALEATPINALMITARLPARNLGRSRYLLLEPQKIEGVKLPFFIQAYVEQRLQQAGQRSLFADDYTELYRASTRLSSMMAATLQSATALLVRMYADQVIDVGGLKTAQLPDNIPQLMEKYVAWLNRPSAVDASVRRHTFEVQRDARIVAWECLKQTYSPAETRYEAVIQGLAVRSPEAGDPEDDAQARLHYLSHVLRLAQVSDAGTAVRLPLDPVAEYLAALHIAEHCQQEETEERWQCFLESVDAGIERQPLMRGFLLAVRNCCDRIPHLPEGVMEALTQRAQLNPEELRQAQLKYRISRLIDDLYDSNPKYLSQAIHNLRDEGADAYRAVPDLIHVMNSQRVSAELRIEAVDALMAIAPEAGKLQEPFYTLFAECSEAYALRIRLGQALRALGVLRQLLVVELQPDQTRTITLVDAPETATLDLVEGIALTMVRIPAGSFWMGSAADDPDGNDMERPQHAVTVAEFWMAAYPITQAQWYAVSTLPKLHCALKPEPAQFGGAMRDRCPVESVSWEEAVEFCDRLTRFFQPRSSFRLPSEAEWEYACRAGTQTPFHFGNRLATLANVRSRRTTPVGQFQVANRFGLYDMHGNVSEWCQDIWHSSYIDAPREGRPWTSGGDVTRRVVRGGSWLNGEQLCRSAAREASSPSLRSEMTGFRIVCAALK